MCTCILNKFYYNFQLTGDLHRTTGRKGIWGIFVCYLRRKQFLYHQVVLDTIRDYIQWKRIEPKFSGTYAGFFFVKILRVIHNSANLRIVTAEASNVQFFLVEKILRIIHNPVNLRICIMAIEAQTRCTKILKKLKEIVFKFWRQDAYV